MLAATLITALLAFAGWCRFILDDLREFIALKRHPDLQAIYGDVPHLNGELLSRQQQTGGRGAATKGSHRDNGGTHQHNPSLSDSGDRGGI